MKFAVVLSFFLVGCKSSESRCKMILISLSSLVAAVSVGAPVPIELGEDIAVVGFSRSQVIHPKLNPIIS
jgi:uncharacterized protein YcfL